MKEFGGDAIDDLLRALEAKSEECDELCGQMQQLVGEWMWAETHHLVLADICWMRSNKVDVQETPDGRWAFTRAGKQLCVSDTIKQGIAVVRAFGLDT